MPYHAVQIFRLRTRRCGKKSLIIKLTRHIDDGNRENIGAELILPIIISCCFYVTAYVQRIYTFTTSVTAVDVIQCHCKYLQRAYYQLNDFHVSR